MPAEHRKSGPEDSPVEIALSGLALPASLAVPAAARGVVVFVLGPGRDHRASARVVARRLGAVGVGALLFELRGRNEHPREVAVDGEVAERELLAVRVLAVTRWLRAHPLARELPVGYFGDDAGAGVALLAAAEDPTIAAVVSGGGLELAPAWLHCVRAPTLLIVGTDAVALARSRDAARHLRSEHEIVVVPGSTHPTREPRALETVAEESARWFVRHLVAERASTGDRELR